MSLEGFNLFIYLCVVGPSFSNHPFLNSLLNLFSVNFYIFDNFTLSGNAKMTSESEIREKRERFMYLWKSMKNDPSKIQQASVILDVIALLDRILLT